MAALTGVATANPDIRPMAGQSPQHQPLTAQQVLERCQAELKTRQLGEQMKHAAHQKDQAVVQGIIEQMKAQQQAQDGGDGAPILQKLDSIYSENGNSYSIKYDVERQILTGYTSYSLWETRTCEFEYDSHMNLTYESSASETNEGKKYGYTRRFEYNDADLQTFVQTEDWEDNPEQVTGWKYLYEFDDRGNMLSYESMEYNYRDGIFFHRKEVREFDEYGFCTSSTDYYGTPDLIPQELYEFKRDGSENHYEWNGSQWLLTSAISFNEMRNVRTLNSYIIIDGNSCLLRTEIEKRTGWNTDFYSNEPLELTSLSYDPFSGNINEGFKYYYYNSWGSKYGEDYYVWDATTNGWNQLYHNFYLSEYEGNSIILTEIWGSQILVMDNKEYHNGAWHTTWYTQNDYVVKENLENYNYPSYTYLQNHYLSYEVNWQTGETTRYEEYNYMLNEKGQIMQKIDYSAPGQLSGQQLYYYDQYDQLAEIQIYLVKGGLMTYSAHQVYEYDYDTPINQVLGMPGTLSNYVAPYAIPSYCVFKPLSVKAFNADGSLITVIQEFIYSPVEGSQSAPQLMQDPAAASRYYNLQGQTVPAPVRGQLYVTDQGRKLIQK